jgi:hypothetical protein
MNPVIIQAIAADQVQAMHEHAVTRQPTADNDRTSAARPWLRWPGPGCGPASRTARPWRDRAAAVLVALSQGQAGGSVSALSCYRPAISVRAPR